MAVGRSFEEAFQKALRMVNENVNGFDWDLQKVSEEVGCIMSDSVQGFMFKQGKGWLLYVTQKFNSVICKRCKTLNSKVYGGFSIQKLQKR